MNLWFRLRRAGNESFVFKEGACNYIDIMPQFDHYVSAFVERRTAVARLTGGKSMLKIKTLLTLGLVLALSLRSSLGAVDFKDQANTPWDQKAGSGPDAVVGGWYINLGITGARAKLTEKFQELSQGRS